MLASIRGEVPSPRPLPCSGAGSFFDRLGMKSSAAAGRRAPSGLAAFRWRLRIAIADDFHDIVFGLPLGRILFFRGSLIASISGHE